MDIEPRIIEAPPSWWSAFDAAAKCAGMSLDDWCRDALLRGLPDNVRGTLPAVIDESWTDKVTTPRPYERGQCVCGKPLGTYRYRCDDCARIHREAQRKPGKVGPPARDKKTADRIVALRIDGHSLGEIAEKVKMSKEGVRIVLYREVAARGLNIPRRPRGKQPKNPK